VPFARPPRVTTLSLLSVLVPSTLPGTVSAGVGSPSGGVALPAPASPAQVAFARGLVRQVSEASLMADVRALQTLGTRYAPGRGYGAAADWAKAQFQAAGLTDAQGMASSAVRRPLGFARSQPRAPCPRLFRRMAAPRKRSTTPHNRKSGPRYIAA
jgi:hypothetical protein